MTRRPRCRPWFSIMSAIVLPPHSSRRGRAAPRHIAPTTRSGGALYFVLPQNYQPPILLLTATLPTLGVTHSCAPFFKTFGAILRTQRCTCTT